MSLSPECLSISEHADYSDLDYDKKYSEHAARCAICGHRIWQNTHPRFRENVRAVIWRMFVPLAFVEVALTFSLTVSMVQLTVAAIATCALIAVATSALYLVVHITRFRKLMLEQLMPILSYKYFRTGVDDVPPDDQVVHARHLLMSYIQLSRESSLAGFLAYALVSIGVWVVFGSSIAAVLIGLLGALWALLFRARLASLQPLEVVDLSARERQQLLQLAERSSWTYRGLMVDGLVGTMLSFHKVLLSIVGAVAFLGCVTAASSPRIGLIALCVIGGAAGMMYVFDRWIVGQYVISDSRIGSLRRCIFFSDCALRGC